MSVVRATRWLVVLIAVLAVASCGGKSAGDAAEPQQATLHVTNDHWSDVNVFVIRNGARFRLGMVTTAMDRYFVLPTEATVGSADVRLVADPIGSRRTYTSPAILVTAGEHVVWRIANQMSLSTLSVVRGSGF